MGSDEISGHKNKAFAGDSDKSKIELIDTISSSMVVYDWFEREDIESMKSLAIQKGIRNAKYVRSSAS